MKEPLGIYILSSREVTKAIDTRTNEAVALKRVLMTNQKDGFPVTAIREMRILQQMDSPFIIKLKEMATLRSENKRELFFVFPFMENDLTGLLNSSELKLEHLKCYAKQLLQGVSYLHNIQKAMHRDIKTSNLLINNKGELKIADFGLAKQIDPYKQSYTPNLITRWFRAPEILLGDRNYGPAVDMWGVGCVLGEMFTKKPILMGSSDLHQLELVCQLCGTPDSQSMPGCESLPDLPAVSLPKYTRKVKETFEKYDKQAADLIDKLLVLDKNKRLTAEEALKHPFFMTDPLPCDPSEIPPHKSMHEYECKRVKRETANLQAQKADPWEVGVASLKDEFVDFEESTGSVRDSTSIGREPRKDCDSRSDRSRELKSIQRKDRDNEYNRDYDSHRDHDYNRDYDRHSRDSRREYYSGSSRDHYSDRRRESERRDQDRRRTISHEYEPLSRDNQSRRDSDRSMDRSREYNRSPFHSGRSRSPRRDHRRYSSRVSEGSHSPRRRASRSRSPRRRVSRSRSPRRRVSRSRSPYRRASRSRSPQRPPPIKDWGRPSLK